MLKGFGQGSDINLYLKYAFMRPGERLHCIKTGRKGWGGQSELLYS